MTFKRILGAVAMLILGEAIYFATDLWKTWVEVNYGAPIKAQQRAAVVEETARDTTNHTIHLGQRAFPQSAIQAYPCVTADVSIWDGKGVTNSNWIKWLKEQDEKLFTSQSMVKIEPSTGIVPFVYWKPQEQRRGFRNLDAKPETNGLAIVNLDDLGGIDCVVAAMGDQIVWVWLLWNNDPEDGV